MIITTSKFVVTTTQHQQKWQLVKPFTIEDESYIYVVPKGFVSNGSSIPPFFTPFVGHSMTRSHAPAGFFHDWLLGQRKVRVIQKSNGRFANISVNTKQKDKMWLDTVLYFGKSPMLAQTEYYGLRLATIITTTLKQHKQ